MREIPGIIHLPEDGAGSGKAAGRIDHAAGILADPEMGAVFIVLAPEP